MFTLLSISNYIELFSQLKSYAEESSDQYTHGRERVKDFFFDFSYWSFDLNAKHFASQRQVK